MLSGQQIIERIRNDPKIPAPSQTIFKILELTRESDCSVQVLAELIGRDGGLTAQILRQANSVLYGFNTATSSVSEACMRLGLKRVRSAVINQHVVNGLGNARPKGFDPHRYWQAALATSVAAQDLCGRFLRGAAEDAGTAGLLTDIGVGLLAFGAPAEYTRVLEQVAREEGARLDRVEHAALGVTHADVGAAVLRDWSLDDLVVTAVQNHHGEAPEDDGQDAVTFARVVAAGATISHIAMTGSDMEAVDTLFTQVGLLTPTPDDVVAELLDVLVTHIQQTADTLSVELGSVDTMEANFDQLLNDMPDVGGSMSFRAAAREV
jgi:HD-like signal output (HDOD) protein